MIKSLRIAIDTFRLNFDNLLMVSLIYLVLPLGLSFFMIFSVAGSISQEASPKLLVTIKNEDPSEISQAYVQALEATGVITPSEDGNYTVTLPAGFGDALVTGQWTSADSENSKHLSLENVDGGQTGETILEEILTEVAKAFHRNAAIVENMAQEGLSAAEQASILSQIATSEASLTNLIHSETIQNDSQDLRTAMNESYAFGYLSYIIAIFAMTIPSSLRDMQKKGTAARIASTPTAKSHIVVSDFISTWWLALVMLVVYLIVHRLVTGVFLGNLGIYILIMAVFSAVAISAIVLINSLIPNTTVTTILVTILMIIQVISATITPLISGPSGNILSQVIDAIRVDKSMQTMFTNNRLGVFGQSDLIQLLILVAISIAFLLLTTLRENARKEARI